MFSTPNGRKQRDVSYIGVLVGGMLKPTPVSIEDQLNRIFHSPQFREAPRLQTFLRFVISLTLEGKADQIKESTIASEVFGRTDLEDDSIVRSAAHRLRARLEDYYRQEGAQDPIEIAIPKGSYVPELRERLTAPLQESAALASSAHEPRRKLRWILAGALAVLAIFTILAIYRLHRQQVGRPAGSEARELYLQGRYYWSKRTPEDLNRAIDYFTQAVVKDPRYAQAYTGLADTYNLLSEYTSMPYREAFKRATAAARTAIELDDKLPEAHNALAFSSFYGAWDAVTAEREFKRALELNPNYSTAHHWYATFLMSLGRESEALKQIGEAQILDPSSKSILADKGLILLWAGQIAASRSLLEQIATSDPQFASPHRYLANIYLLEKRYKDYLSESRKHALLSQNNEMLAIIEAGQKGLIEKGAACMLEEMSRAEENSRGSEDTRYYWLAQISAQLGKRSEAIRYLRLALDQHDVNMVTLIADPLFASVRQWPPFQQIVTRVGVG